MKIISFFIIFWINIIINKLWLRINLALKSNWLSLFSFQLWIKEFKTISKVSELPFLVLVETWKKKFKLFSNLKLL